MDVLGEVIGALLELITDGAISAGADAIRQRNRVEHLYAIRFGKGFAYGGPDFAFIYYLAKLKDRWVMIDAGFSSKETAGNARIELLPIGDEIRACLTADVISDILFTHSHWDHMDDVTKYPHANLYMSEATYNLATAENDPLTGSYLRRARSEDRFHLLIPGSRPVHAFKYKKVGGHTKDSGVFYVSHNRKRYCITGDECFSIDYFNNGIGIDNAYNANKNVLFTTRSCRKGIIPLPSHDGSIMDRYTKISENIAQIF